MHRHLLIPALLSALLAGAPHADAQSTRRAPALDGLYQGVRTTLAGKVTLDLITFFPDGRAASEPPDEGLASPPPWARMCAKMQCGSYQVTGNQVTVRYTGGDRAEYEIQAGGVLRRANSQRRYRPLAPLDALRLDGVYAVQWQDGRVVMGITFAADGRFREYNLLAYSGWVLRGQTYWDDEGRARVVVGEGSGTYRISRNTLELRYTNGPTARFLIFVPPGVAVGPQPSTIYLGLTRLERAP